MLNKQTSFPIPAEKTRKKLYVVCALYILAFVLFVCTSFRLLEEIFYELRLRTNPRIVFTPSVSGMVKRAGFVNEIDCENDFDTEPRLVSHGDYLILYNAFTSNKYPPCDGDITIAVHGDPSYLKYVKDLAEAYKGAISMAIYLNRFWSAEQFTQVAEAVAHLRACTQGDVADWVIFHFYWLRQKSDHSDDHRLASIKEIMAMDNLTYDYDELYQKKVRSLMNAREMETWTDDVSKIDCEGLPKWSKLNLTRVKSGGNKTSADLYPINVGRNIAINGSNTFYVMPSDVKLVPGPFGIQHKILHMVRTNPEKNFAGYPSEVGRTAFVLPIYEVTENTTDFPVANKTVLMKKIKEGTAVRFHMATCKVCYTYPHADEWEKNQWSNLTIIGPNPTPEIARIQTVTKRVGQYQSWDPVFIAPKHDIPQYREDVFFEGKEDRKPTMYEMCANNYEFAVIEEGFLVHQPGIKINTSVPDWRKVLIDKQHNNLNTEVIEELRKKYPDSTNVCRY